MKSYSMTKEKPFNKFIIFSALIFLVIFVIEKINGRFWLNDFKVFYSAAEALIHHEKVYGKAFGLETGFYKYSPVALLFFTPFTIISFESAAIIDFVINAIVCISIIIVTQQLITEYIFQNKNKKTVTLFLIFICVINHVVRELHLGNTNLILILLLVNSIKLELRKKSMLAGVLLALVILTKPYFLILLLPFLLFKRQKAIVSTLMSILIFVAITFFVFGVGKGQELYSEWFLAMKDHSSYLSSNHTLFSLLNTYFGIIIPGNYGIVFLVVFSVASFVILWAYDLFKSDQGSSINKNNSTFIYYYFILIAVVPSILITDTEHFLFSLPLIALLITKIVNEKIKWQMSLLLIVMLMYGGNSSDIWGKNLARKFENFGMLGLGNLMLVIWGIVMMMDIIKMNAKSPVNNQ